MVKEPSHHRKPAYHSEEDEEEDVDETVTRGNLDNDLENLDFEEDQLKDAEGEDGGNEEDERDKGDEEGERGDEYRKKKRKGSTPFSSSSSTSLKQNQKKQRSLFVETEAQVGDDEEEEYEEDDTLADDFVDQDELLEAEQTYEKILSMRRRPLSETLPSSHHRGRYDDDEQSYAKEAEKETQRIKSLYGRSEAAARAAAESGYVPDTFLTPTVQDPKLWMVKCGPGKERMLVFNLMRKFLDHEGQAKIYSAVSRDHLKGFIYIEAHNRQDVVLFCDKMLHLYTSKVTLVPISEMPDILKVFPHELKIRPGSWVRVKRGKYASDLAQVLDINESMETATIKLQPRLDVFGPRIPPSHRPDASKKAFKAYTLANRPPAKLFNPVEVSEYSKNISKSQGYWVFNGEYFKDGYLEKEIRLVGLDQSPPPPTLDELSKFSGIIDGQDIQLSDLPALQDVAGGAPIKFYKGDLVEVTDGELVRKLGRIHIVDPEQAVLMMLDDDISSMTHTVSLKSLKKIFKTGDHARVLNGKHAGETGLIVSVSGPLVTLFSDRTKEEIKVFARDLRDATNEDTTDSALSFVGTSRRANGSGGRGAGSNGAMYSLDDLVQFDASNVGVILEIKSRDSLLVIDQTGAVRQVSTSCVSLKMSASSASSRINAAMTLDAYNQPIRAGCSVKILHGSFQMQTGVILHVHRSFIFARLSEEAVVGISEAIAPKRRIIALRSTGIALVGAKGEIIGQGHSSARPSSTIAMNPTSLSLGSGRGGGMVRSMRGKTVIVVKGSYKGLSGLVKDIDQSAMIADIELHTNSRRVFVSLDHVQFEGGATSSGVGGYSSIPGGAATPSSWGSSGFRTPVPANSGFRTPGGWETGSRTPGGDRAFELGSRTPGWMAGGSQAPGGWTTPGVGQAAGWRTPVAGPSDGWRTPATGGFLSGRTDIGGGNMTPSAAASGWTPSGGDGTPGWATSDSSVSTPIPPYGTPGYAHGASTPGWGSNSSAASSHGWGSTTPSYAGATTPSHFPPKSPGLPPPPPLKTGFSEDWARPNLQVVLTSHGNKKAVIEGFASDGQVPVRLIDKEDSDAVLDSSLSLTIPVESLVLTRPSKKDKIVVLQGEYSGTTGSLVGIDGSDAIVKVDIKGPSSEEASSSSGFIIVPASLVGKIYRK